MEPLNSAERTKALLKFSVMFIVTTLLVCISAFIGVKIPTVQIQQLKEENERLQEMNSQSNLRLVLIDSLQRSLDRYDLDTLRQKQIELEINQCIVNIQTITKNDSSVNSRITKNAAIIGTTLLQSKLKLKECSNSSSIIAEYKSQVVELQKKYDDLYKDFLLIGRNSGFPVK